MLISRVVLHDPLTDRASESPLRLGGRQMLSSPDFDFRKLIRLSEEMNIAFQEECYFATAMLIRALLDHVPVRGFWGKCRVFSPV